MATDYTRGSKDNEDVSAAPYKMGDKDVYSIPWKNLSNSEHPVTALNRLLTKVVNTNQKLAKHGDPIEIHFVKKNGDLVPSSELGSVNESDLLTEERTNSRGEKILCVATVGRGGFKVDADTLQDLGTVSNIAVDSDGDTKTDISSSQDDAGWGLSGSTFVMSDYLKTLASSGGEEDRALAKNYVDSVKSFFNSLPRDEKGRAITTCACCGRQRSDRKDLHIIRYTGEEPLVFGKLPPYEQNSMLVVGNSCDDQMHACSASMLLAEAEGTDMFENFRTGSLQVAMNPARIACYLNIVSEMRLYDMYRYLMDTCGEDNPDVDFTPHMRGDLDDVRDFVRNGMTLDDADKDAKLRAYFSKKIDEVIANPPFVSYEKQTLDNRNYGHESTSVKTAKVVHDLFESSPSFVDAQYFQRNKQRAVLFGMLCEKLGIDKTTVDVMEQRNAQNGQSLQDILVAEIERHSKRLDLTDDVLCHNLSVMQSVANDKGAYLHRDYVQLLADVLALADAREGKTLYRSPIMPAYTRCQTPVNVYTDKSGASCLKVTWPNFRNPKELVEYTCSMDEVRRSGLRPENIRALMFGAQSQGVRLDAQALENNHKLKFVPVSNPMDAGFYLGEGKARVNMNPSDIITQISFHRPPGMRKTKGGFGADDFGHHRRRNGKDRENVGTDYEDTDGASAAGVVILRGFRDCVRNESNFEKNTVKPSGVLKAEDVAIALNGKVWARVFLDPANSGNVWYVNVTGCDFHQENDKSWSVQIPADKVDKLQIAQRKKGMSDWLYFDMSLQEIQNRQNAVRERTDGQKQGEGTSEEKSQLLCMRFDELAKGANFRGKYGAYVCMTPSNPNAYTVVEITKDEWEKAKAELGRNDARGKSGHVYFSAERAKQLQIVEFPSEYNDVEWVTWPVSLSYIQSAQAATDAARESASRKRKSRRIEDCTEDRTIVVDKSRMKLYGRTIWKASVALDGERPKQLFDVDVSKCPRKTEGNMVYITIPANQERLDVQLHGTQRRGGVYKYMHATEFLRQYHHAQEIINKNSHRVANREHAADDIVRPVNSDRDFGG